MKEKRESFCLLGMSRSLWTTRAHSFPIRRQVLLGLLGLGTLGSGATVVVRDPRLIVVLVDTRGDANRLVARQGLGDLDGLLALLASTRSLLGLRKQGLDPGLVDEVDGATEDAGQEEVEEDTRNSQLLNCRSEVFSLNVHLRVKDAGRRLHNAGQTAVRLNLEDLVLLVGDDGQEVEDNVLRLHIQHEGVGQSASLAGTNVDIVAHGRQVAQNTGGGRRILGERLCRCQHTTNEDHVDGALLVVRDFDHGAGRVTIDELDAEVRVGESRGDVNLQLRGLSGGRSLRILGLVDTR